MITIRSNHERNSLRIIVDAAIPQKTVVIGTDVDKTVVGNGKNKELYTQDVVQGLGKYPAITKKERNG